MEGSKYFIRVDRDMLGSYIKSVPNNSSAPIVLFYIWEKCEFKTNKFIGTYQNIADATGVSLVSVKRVLGAVKKDINNLLVSDGNKIWMIHPDISYMGGNEWKTGEKYFALLGEWHRLSGIRREKNA